MLDSPARDRRSPVTGPMPGSARSGRGARNRASCPAGTITRPCGLSASDAIFATVLHVPHPNDASSPVSRRTVSCSRERNRRAPPDVHTARYRSM